MACEQMPAGKQGSFAEDLDYLDGFHPAYWELSWKFQNQQSHLLQRPEHSTNRGLPRSNNETLNQDTLSINDVTMNNADVNTNDPLPSHPPTRRPRVTHQSATHSSLHLRTCESWTPKAVTAKHHLEFLQSLRQLNLVPKGLQVKAINILHQRTKAYRNWRQHSSQGATPPTY